MPINLSKEICKLLREPVFIWIRTKCCSSGDTLWSFLRALTYFYTHAFLVSVSHFLTLVLQSAMCTVLSGGGGQYMLGVHFHNALSIKPFYKRQLAGAPEWEFNPDLYSLPHLSPRVPLGSIADSPFQEVMLKDIQIITTQIIATGHAKYSFNLAYYKGVWCRPPTVWTMWYTTDPHVTCPRWLSHCFDSILLRKDALGHNSKTTAKPFKNWAQNTSLLH